MKLAVIEKTTNVEAKKTVRLNIQKNQREISRQRYLEYQLDTLEKEAIFQPLSDLEHEVLQDALQITRKAMDQVLRNLSNSFIEMMSV